MIQLGIELEPLSPLIAHTWVMNAIFSRRYGEARERALQSLSVNPHLFLLHLWLGVTYLFEQKFDEAIQAIERAADLTAGKISWVTGSLGHAHAFAGNPREALHWTEKACDAIGFISVWLAGDPRFDPLRGEPRFQAVLRRMNLPV